MIYFNGKTVVTHSTTFEFSKNRYGQPHKAMICKNQKFYFYHPHNYDRIKRK